jgi:AcrR family transcriptional regulator
MRDIADASGLLAGSLYSHFRSKSEILRLILEPLLDRLIPTQEAVLHSEGSGLDRLSRMIYEVMTIVGEHDEEVTILHYDWSELAPVAELTPIAEQSNQFLALWRAAVVEGIDDGTIRDDIHPDTAVRAITSCLHAVVDRKRFQVLPGTVSPPHQVESLSRQLQAIFSSGLAAPKKPGSRSRRGKA